MPERQPGLSQLAQHRSSGLAALDMISQSDAQTQRYGAHLAEVLQPGDVVLLHGSLGAGKTTFARGVALGLGIRSRVTSPTFTLINEYREGRLPLYHIDLYRVASEEEVLDLGIEDYLYGDGVCLIEWAAKVPDVLPEVRLEVTLVIMTETTRRVLLEARGPRYTLLLQEFRRHIFG